MKEYIKLLDTYYKRTQKYHKWIFPAVCMMIFLILCAASIHGSSIGSYWAATSRGAKDPDLLYGNPRGIRSDEWIVGSPFVYSQKTQNYSVINRTVGNGQDMAIVLDVPYKEWSAIFRPQNLAFFVAPFSVAFAFRWWFPFLVLLVSCYLLFRLLLPPPKNNLLSALLALVFSISPFVMWWYTGGTLFSLGYVVLLAYLLIRMLETPKFTSKLILSSAIAYVGVALAITMYVPFIVGSCFAGLFVVLGYLGIKKNYKRLLNRANIICVLLSVCAAALLLAAFYFGHHEAIKTLQDTAYPGRLSAPNAPLRAQLLFNVFAQFFLQSNKYQIINSNQSEFSNFIYLFIYMTIPAIYVIYRGIRSKKNDWFLIAVSIGLIVILLRMFLPFDTDPILRFVLLDRVANGRLIIGLGLLNIMFIIGWIRNIIKSKDTLPGWLVAATGFGAVIILLVQYQAFKAEYNFISSYTDLYTLFLFIMLLATTLLFMSKRTVLYGAIAYAVIAVSMTFYVNPLYRGVPFEKDVLISTIKQIDSAKPGTWAVLNNLVIENYPNMAGVKNISGVMIYPQFELWESFPNYSDYQNTINRYAHIGFSINSQHNNSMDLVRPDYYLVNIDPCDNFAQRNINFVVGIVPENSTCLEEVANLKLNQKPIFIYKTIKSTISQ